MRYLTDETHLARVPLRKELDFIEKYIAIEKIRFGDDARILFNLEDADLNDKWIEPFLMVTLVENAFKHGFYTNIRHAFVIINVKIKDKELAFSVENSIANIQHFQTDSREGKGIENLKKRLALLYPKNPGLTIRQNDNSYAANFKINLNEPI